MKFHGGTQVHWRNETKSEHLKTPQGHCLKVFLNPKNSFNKTCSPKWPWFRLGLRARFTRK